MPFQVTCSSCNKTFNVRDALANKTAKCPNCSGLIQLSVPSADEKILDAEKDNPNQAIQQTTNSSDEPSESDSDRKPCPMCGEMIQKVAIKCRFCGAIFDQVLANAARRRGPSPVPGESVEEAAKRLIAEKQDKTTALQIFLTSLVGCFAPIILIYGIVFLLRRPYSFPRKGLAVAGTVIHGIWTLILVASLIVNQSHLHR